MRTRYTLYKVGSKDPLWTTDCIYAFKAYRKEIDPKQELTTFTVGPWDDRAEDGEREE